MKPEAQGSNDSTVQGSGEAQLMQLSSRDRSTKGTGGPVQPPRIPDHELLRCIGRGAYGEVWLGRSVLGEFRAIKIVYRKSFDHDRPYEREFEGIQKFEPISRGHESQVDILHVGRDEQAGYFYYVMELADDAGQENEAGGTRNAAAARSPKATLSPETYVPHTLKLALNRRKHLPVDECIQIGLSLTTALEHLHGNGLLHRDIKPSNIIFMKGVPKLGDIGLVASMDATMSFVGTAGFLPPEGPGTPQGDIYSLGKVLYEMCMGHDRQEFPKLPGNLHEFKDPARLLELNAVILKACHTDPRQRYQSAAEMGAELALLQGGKSVKRERAVKRRWDIAKKLAIAAVVTGLLIATVPFLKSTRAYVPKPEAARFYELGRWHYNQLTPASHKKALEYLNRAVQSDPKFIEPYAEIIEVYIWNEIGLPTEQERRQAAKAIADKLLVVAPDSAECHTALSFCRFLDRDWRAAEEEIVKAIKIKPNLPIARHFYSFYLTMLRRFEEAHRQADKAQELEPSARTSAIIAAWPFMGERRYDRAIAQLQKAMDLDKNFVSGHTFLGQCYEAQSNYLAAVEEFKKGAVISGEDPPEKVTEIFRQLRQACETAGQEGYLQKAIELIHAEASLPENQRYFPDEDLARYSARLGDKEAALKILEQEVDVPGWHKLLFEPFYDSLHDEPRFKALVKRAGLER